MTDISQPASTKQRLIVPALGGIYSGLHEGAETLLRVVAGLALVVHGAGKIVDPFGAAQMVESIGFYPGAFWSLVLACTEFFGGILIAVGLLTRPASFAAFIVLLVTVYYHGVLLGDGYMRTEKSILWSAIFFYFTIRGGNRHSIDAKIGRVF